jgi:hypothetical protein
VPITRWAKWPFACPGVPVMRISKVIIWLPIAASFIVGGPAARRVWKGLARCTLAKLVGRFIGHASSHLELCCLLELQLFE